MRMCNTKSQKRSAKGSNFKDDERALPIYRSYYSMADTQEDQNPYFYHNHRISEPNLHCQKFLFFSFQTVCLQHVHSVHCTLQTVQYINTLQLHEHQLKLFTETNIILYTLTAYCIFEIKNALLSIRHRKQNKTNQYN